MNSEITGKIIVVGDNIDTDQIYPGCYLALTDPKEIGSHCLSGVDENIAANFPQGGIVVAGRNFGCGSSREHAPIALLNMGAKAVIADSFARIFFRNCVATGEVYPCETATALRTEFKTGDEAELDIEQGTITRLADGKVFPLKELGAVAPVVAAGGMFGYARQVGMIAK